MNVYEKLQVCRVKLQELTLKKTGKNTFADYNYYELGDFLPHINRLFLEQKLFSMVGFTPELATLTILNIEKPDEVITITSPMATASLKGCHDIQNLGAVETYQRRYLYMAALEIVESDALDAGANIDKPGSGQKNQGSAKQRQQAPPAQPQSQPSASPQPAQPQQSGGKAQDELDAKARKALFAAVNTAGVSVEVAKLWINYSWADNPTSGGVVPASTKEVPGWFIRQLATQLTSGKTNAQQIDVYVDSKRFMGPDEVPGEESQDAVF